MLPENFWRKNRTNMRRNAIVFCCLLAQAASAQYHLEYYLHIARQNSPLIREQQHLLRSLQADAARLRALFTAPQLDLTANYLLSPIISRDDGQTRFLLNPAHATDYYGHDLAISNGGKYQLLINLNKPLFFSHRLQTTAEQLRISALSCNYQAMLAGHELDKLVTEHYLNCLNELKQIRHAEALLALLSEQKDLLQHLVQHGLYKPSDLILLNLEYQQQVQSLLAFRSAYRRKLLDLYLLCGIRDTATVTLNDTILLPALPPQPSHFAEKFRLDSLRLVADQHVFDLKYKPVFNLYANAGWNAVYLPDLPNRLGFSAGFSISYPLYDGQQRRWYHERTRALEQTVIAYQEQFNTQQTVRRIQQYEQLHNLNQQIALAGQQLEEHEKLLAVYRLELQAGQLSVVQYLLALRNLTAARRDYATLQHQQQLLINEINYWNW